MGQPQRAIELSESEADEFVADEIRRALGLSTDEFRQKIADGTIEDRPIVRHLALLAGVRSPSC